MRYAPRFPRQENGLGFCDREGTKSLSVFRERRQVYKPPSPVSCGLKAGAFCRKIYLKLRYISASSRLSFPAGGTKCPEVAERRASVKAETSGLAPGLDRRPSPRLQVGKGGQAPVGACPPRLSAWGRSLPKSKRGGQAPLGLARLDYCSARPGGAVNGGALVRRSSRPLTAPAGVATPPSILAAL